MNLIWPDLRVPLDLDEAELPYLLAQRLKISSADIKHWRIVRRSIDARKKPEIFFAYSLEFELNLPPKAVSKLLARFPQVRIRPVAQERPVIFQPQKKLTTRPVVIGSGPAGYFAALTLAEKGYCPLVLERGDMVEKRSSRVEQFWQSGDLDPESNVQFGEGGAGTFSDGKLTTRIDDPLVRAVLEKFVEFGADPDILISAKPHIGTDVLKSVVARMRQRIISLGGEVHFRAKVTGFKTAGGRLEGVEINQQEMIGAETAILAVGHSARDLYETLRKMGAALEPKPFAIGLRIEHKQETINLAQYGTARHPRLGAADYQLTYKDILSGRGAYSFCMCPGGQVVAAASEQGGVVTNGMSNHARDSGIANSALVVTVGRKDFASEDCLAGMAFQREWERRAFQAGGGDYYVPAQKVTDFLSGRQTKHFSLEPSYRPGYRSVMLQTILPREIAEVLARAILYFDGKIRGFAGEEATLCGIESRTSAPLRILRDESGQALNLRGLFPAGEGAGYAGGITSSAVDGIKAAEKLMMQYVPA